MSNPEPQYHYDWADLAFGSKKPLRELRATFIAAPRELSEKRFKELVKTYLPKGNIVLGISKEAFVEGFEGQLQFKMLERADVQTVINKVNHSQKSPHRIYTLRYYQRELPYILDKVSFLQVLFIRGSWQYSFHTLPIYYTLTSKDIPYEMVSPFVDEAEAKMYESTLFEQRSKRILETRFDILSETGMLAAADTIATYSYDYSFQTGVVLGVKVPDAPDKYTFLQGAYNKVVPYETYALHHGSSREEHFSPPNDLNHYDAVHAEMELLVFALERKLDLKDTTLFINLLPCPSCARTLSQTSIKEVIYRIDHSDGYAVKILEATGKLVRRVV